MNSRTGLPVPQHTTSGAPAALASANRLMSAAATCERYSPNTSCSPYRFVMMGNCPLIPYCRAYALSATCCTFLVKPYDSTEGCRGPAQKSDSFMSPLTSPAYAQAEPMDMKRLT